MVGWVHELVHEADETSASDNRTFARTYARMLRVAHSELQPLDDIQLALG